MSSPSRKLTNEVPIACNLSAIPAEALEQHKAMAAELFLAVEESRELPDGYAFRLPGRTELWLQAAEFIKNERLCCPFFRFTLEFEPAGGPVWLKLTGSEAVKLFIQAEILPSAARRS